jgi:hypothetical protein
MQPGVAFHEVVTGDEGAVLHEHNQTKILVAAAEGNSADVEHQNAAIAGDSTNQQQQNTAVHAGDSPARHSDDSGDNMTAAISSDNESSSDKSSKSSHSESNSNSVSSISSQERSADAQTSLSDHACASNGSTASKDGFLGGTQQDELVPILMQPVLASVGADFIGRAKLTGWQTPSATHHGGWCMCVNKGKTWVCHHVI